jgi:methionine-rich copper-binding protein CopC
MRRADFLWAGLALAALPLGRAGAQSLRLLESSPAPGAVLDRRPQRFFARFDRPVDHYRSRLLVISGGRLVQMLDPRLEAAPEVLFAEVPPLAAGAYEFRWSVVSLEGNLISEGTAAFTVRP